MTTTFAHIPEDLHDKESFFDDFKDAQWHWLTQDQSQRLYSLFDASNNKNWTKSLPEVLNTQEWDIEVDGSVLEIWQSIPEDQRLDMEAWIRHLVSQWERWQLLLGSWFEDVSESIGFEDRLLDGPVPWESYNILGKRYESDESKNQFLLLLRVEPQYNSSIDAIISPELVQIPSRWGLVKIGYVFHKNLTPQEFLKETVDHKKDLHVWSDSVAA